MSRPGSFRAPRAPFLIAALLLAAPASVLAQDAEETFTVSRSPFIANCAPPPAAEEFCRAAPAFNAYDAARKLGERNFIIWADGTSLNVAARSTGKAVQLTGAIDDGLAPLSRGLPYFGATYHMSHLDESVVDLALKDRPADDFGLVYRGPKAPAPPPSNAELKGHFETIEIKSAALRAVRKVSIYVPPGTAPKGGWPTIVATGGDAAAPLAAILDALIERREARPVAMVALWPREGEGDRAPLGPSAREYVRGADADSYARHNLFVRREVLPVVDKRFGLSESGRLLLGWGNGADWAVESIARDPDFARTAAAFSAPGQSEPPFSRPQAKLFRIYFAAGAYEGPWMKGARVLANIAGASGVPHSFDVVYGGHSPLTWQYEFAKVAREAFPPIPEPKRGRKARG